MLNFFVVVLSFVFFIFPSVLQAQLKVYATSSDGNIAVLNPYDNTYINSFIPSFGSVTADGLQGVAISPDQTTAYVADSVNKGLWIINTINDTIQTFVHFEVANNPREVIVTPNGQKVYIADNSAGVIWVVHTVDNSVSTISGGAAKPSGLALSPGGDKLYVSDIGFSALSVYVYKTDDDSFLHTISGMNPANYIAVNTSGIGYEPSSNSTSIAVFDTSVDLSLGSIATSGSDLDGVAFTNDGTIAYVASNGDHSLLVVENGVVSNVISLTEAPWQVTVNPVDNRQVYCTANPMSTVMLIYDQIQIESSSYNSNLSHIGYLAYINIPPTAPNSLRGRVINERFLTQTDVVHHLSWNASPSENVVSYAIFRNGILIAMVSAKGPLKYDDHNRRHQPPDFYQVRSVDSQGVESVPISVFVP